MVDSRLAFLRSVFLGVVITVSPLKFSQPQRGADSPHLRENVVASVASASGPRLRTRKAVIPRQLGHGCPMPSSTFAAHSLRRAKTLACLLYAKPSQRFRSALTPLAWGLGNSLRLVAWPIPFPVGSRCRAHSAFPPLCLHRGAIIKGHRPSLHTV